MPAVLAKPALDVGIYTDRLADAMGFYGGTLGLEYEELLEAGGGIHQHRYGLRGSVLKVNHSRDALRDAPTGFRRLVVAATGGASPRRLRDPDGLPVDVVAAGTDGVTAVGVEWHVPDVAAVGEILVAGLGGELVADDRVRIGTTMLLLDAAPRRRRPRSLRARGFRYLTVQVTDAAAVHRELLGLGAEEAVAPRRLGDVAFISFVLLPGGDWLEISQRASLTGPLPER